jgi:hypothetical protein
MILIVAGAGAAAIDDEMQESSTVNENENEMDGLLRLLVACCFVEINMGKRDWH